MRPEGWRHDGWAELTELTVVAELCSASFARRVSPWKDVSCSDFLVVLVSIPPPDLVRGSQQEGPLDSL